MPELTVKLGDQIIQTRRFDGDLLRIGRSRENDIVLENLSVSREHAQLRFHDNHFILTDLNSANGTLVNGVRITKTEIVDEDVITIGKHKLHFHNRIIEDPSTLGGNDALNTIMVEPRAEAWLVVESGRLKDREFKLTRFETSLGKAPGNDVVLTDDWLLSKKQAIILRKGNNAFEIEDLGGLRKVKINGISINGKSDLKNGDTIEIGGTRLTFNASVSSAPAGKTPAERPAGPLQRAALAKSQMPSSRDPLADESLDLEDGFKSVRISIKSDPSLPVASAAVNIPTEPEKKPVPVQQDAAKAQAPVISNLAMPSVPSAASVSAPAEGAGKTVFEDQRSSTRRRRKHQQRNTAQKATTEKNSDKQPISVSAAPVTKEKPTEAPDPKEIKIWEDALNNSSPAIKRQAARMLKKLTGRDYDV